MLNARRMLSRGNPWLIILLTAALIILLLVIYLHRLQRPQWSVAVCDVGQGDAVMVRSGTSVAMIDVGPSRKALEKCLDAFSVSRINLLVFSHYDRDHVGGYRAVSGRVDQVITGEADRKFAHEVEKDLSSSGAKIDRVYQGASGRLGEMSWRILWPHSDAPVKMRQGNPGSVVIAFTTDKFSIVFLGDLGRVSQQQLAKEGIGRYDIVKMAHHGSADQFPQLYSLIGARYGIISSGEGNRYGHPTRAALNILEKNNTEILRTDISGQISISGNRDNFVIWKEKNEG